MSTNLTWHTVRSGETLLSIARKLKVTGRISRSELPFGAARPVTPGQQLIFLGADAASRRANG